MGNPFDNRAASLSGPATDLVPVTPSDTQDLAFVAIALYAETGGTIAFRSVGAPGAVRTVTLGDFSFLPVGIERVMATGTTAVGLHALVLV